MFHFYTPWKRQKNPNVFWHFLDGIEKVVIFRKFDKFIYDGVGSHSLFSVKSFLIDAW